jgi:hypothetical protein
LKFPLAIRLGVPPGIQLNIIKALKAGMFFSDQPANQQKKQF